METITDATTAAFAAEALQTEAPVVLVDFWAPGAAPATPCRRPSKRSRPSATI